MTTETMAAADVFAEAARRGSDFMAGRLDEDGSYPGAPDDIACYYKAPWAFLVTGRPLEANRVLDHIKRHFVRPDGDVAHADGRKSDIDFLESEYRNYANVWVVMGAQKLGRFDVSYPAMRFLLQLQDERTGGFLSGRPDVDAFVRLDALTTSFNGQMCLYMGHEREAERAGAFLVDLLEAQPDRDRFFPTRDLDGTLVLDAPDPSQRLHRVVDARAERQWYFHVGHPAGFLNELYSISGDERFRTAAQGYLDFARRCREDVYAYPPAGKLAWGSATSYRVTREGGARATAERIGRYLLQIQNADGSWRYDGLFDSMEDQPLVTTLDLTHEFVSWLAECGKDLGVGERAGEA